MLNSKSPKELSIMLQKHFRHTSDGCQSPFHSQQPHFLKFGDMHLIFYYLCYIGYNISKLPSHDISNFQVPGCGILYSFFYMVLVTIFFTDNKNIDYCE